MSVPFGTQLAGRYRIDSVLRRGAGVTTYAGVDSATLAPVVVKELRIGDIGEWKEYDLFEREAATLEALRHPGIPRMLAHFALEEDNAAYLVMERVPGESLDKRIERGQPLTQGEVARVLSGVLTILDHLHGLAPPIIHRDVKPGNIVWTPERVYLVDFGGVRRFLPWSTGGSTMVGTFGYMAPEQLHGECSPATDLYSVGATTAALLAGTDASNIPRDGLRFDLSRIPAARPPLREIVARLVEPESSRRFRSASDALAAMSRAGLGDAAAPGSHVALDPSAAAQPYPPGPFPSPAPHAAPHAHVRAPLLTRRHAHDLDLDEGRFAMEVQQPGTIGPSRSGYWRYRVLARWGLVSLGGASLLAAAALELLKLAFFNQIPFLGDAAMVLTQVGLVVTGSGFFVRTKGGFRRKILKLAQKQGGRIHLAEVSTNIGLPPERGRELMEELVESHLARRDHEVRGLYWIGG